MPRGPLPHRTGTRSRRSGITSLRPTARGAATGALVVVLGLAEVLSGRWALSLFLMVFGLPCIAAPVITLLRGRRAEAAYVRATVSPPLVPVGGRCNLVVQLSNDAERPLPPVGLDPPAGPRRAGVLGPDPGRLIRWAPLGPGESFASAFALPTGRRGVHVIGPLRLWVHDPFGLVSRPVAEADRVILVVHPALAPAARTVVPRVVVHPRESGRPDASPAGDEDPGGELSGLRPYRPGDRLRLLSWSAEARYGTLMVHQFQPDGQARISIVVDDRAGVHRKAAFEEALSATYGLVSDACNSSLDVEITTLSGRGSGRASSPEGMVDLLTFLARASPRPVSATNAPLPAGASAVVTTSTARATLPALPGDPTVVVVS